MDVILLIPPPTYFWLLEPYHFKRQFIPCKKCFQTATGCIKVFTSQFFRYLQCFYLNHWSRYKKYLSSFSLKSLTHNFLHCYTWTQLTKISMNTLISVFMKLFYFIVSVALVLPILICLLMCRIPHISWPAYSIILTFSLTLV